MNINEILAPYAGADVRTNNTLEEDLKAYRLAAQQRFDSIGLPRGLWDF